MARIIIDRAKCSGLGICESAAPEFFEVQEDGALALLEHTAEPGKLAEVREAVEGCPTNALSLTEDQL